MFLLKIKVEFFFVILMMPVLMSTVLIFVEKTPVVQLLDIAAIVMGYAIVLMWFFSIFRILYKRAIISFKKYTWLILVLCNSMFLMMIVLLHTAELLSFADGYLVFTAQYALCFLVYSIIEVSIGLRRYELGRPPTFEEWFMEAVCFFFYPLGVWLIQPKLNKIVEQELKNS